MELKHPRAWRPDSEAAATANGAFFVEWLRATGRHAAPAPDMLRGWHATSPDAFAAALGGFLAADLSDPALLAACTAHLLDHDTRPDDRLIWDGAPDDPWVAAARLFGARVYINSAASDAATR